MDLWEKCELYSMRILEANTKIALVSRKSPAQQIHDNILESLLLAILIQSVSRGAISGKQLLIDGGSGSGSPGIPAYLLLSQLSKKIQLVLVDSQRKKQDFLESTREAMDLKDVFVFRGRLESSELKEYCESLEPEFPWLLCTKALANVQKTLNWSKLLRDRLQSLFMMKSLSVLHEIETPQAWRKDWKLEEAHRVSTPHRENLVLQFSPKLSTFDVSRETFD